MKKYIYLYLLLSIVWTYSMGQEQYEPVIEEGKTWQIGAISMNKVSFYPFHYTLSGDTIIKQRVCKKLYRHADDIHFSEPVKYMSALYEEDGRGYIVWSSGNVTDSVNLLYDFHVQTGDTVYNLFCGNKAYTARVIDAGAVQLKEGKRKIVLLRLPDYYGYGRIIIKYWVEGIGYTDDFFGPAASVATYAYKCVSCSVGKDTLFNMLDSEDTNYKVINEYVSLKTSEYLAAIEKWAEEASPIQQVGEFKYYLNKDDMTAQFHSLLKDTTMVEIPQRIVFRDTVYTVTGIEAKAFENSGITKVVLPITVTSIKENAFAGCSSLQELRLPEGLALIGDKAFKNCIGLSNILLPKGLLSIGSGAFQGCTTLKDMRLPESVESIGSYAFSGCAGLKDMDLPNIRSIGNGAFAGCQGLEKVLLGDGLTSIEDETFKGCTSLQDIVLPARLAGIGNSSFIGCTSLREILIPDGVTSIGLDAFEGCSDMEKVTIGKSVQSIPYRCFCDCSNLSTVVNNSLSADIYMYAFRNCPLLKEITITGDTIQNSAFWRCPGLKKVIFTQNVKYLGNRAFRYCGNIKEVYCRAVEPPAMDGTVFDVTSVAYVPTEESLLLYKSSSYQWKYFDLRVEQGTDGIRAIGNPQGDAREVFNLWGQRQNQLLKGVNIIRTKDGTTRKVLVK